MSTVSQIISWVGRKYPNAETNANKILDLDLVHKKTYVKLSRLGHNFDIYETFSIADQPTYSLPSNCTIDNIVAIKVSKDVTITDSTEWLTFKHAALLDNIDSGNWYGKATSTTFVLFVDGLPLATTGLSIRIFYFKKPATITALTDTPELDELYHPLLNFALCQGLAAQGHNPDVEIADYWQKEHDEFYKDAHDNLVDKFNTSPVTTSDTEEYW
jgi:hypothetical protein